MNGVIRYKHSKDTIRGIIENLKTPVEIFKSVNGHKTNRHYFYDTLVRWGCVASIDCEIEYNPAEAISNSSDKLKARRIMEQNNVAIPKTYGLAEIPEDYPVIGRPRKHYGGNHFYFCEDFYDYVEARQNGAEYFTEFYPKTTEYRVHVAHSKVIILAEKVVDENGDNQNPWNLNENGDCKEFNTLRWGEYPHHITTLGIRAVRALGLDYGAVDILADPAYGNYPQAVVLEVNTSPLLGEYGQSRYAEYFDWLLKFPYKVSHFDINNNRHSFTHEDFSYYDIGFDLEQPEKRTYDDDFYSLKKDYNRSIDEYERLLDYNVFENMLIRFTQYIQNR